MEIKDEAVITATDAEGHEYIAEIDAMMTETSADGTETVAEMTTTADPDDPTDVEGHMTVTETAPDGTETVTEYVANDDGVFRVEEDSMFEDMAEAVLGVEIQDDLTQVMNAQGNPVGEDSSDTDAEDAAETDSVDGDIYVAENDSDAGDTDFTDDGGMFGAGDATFETPDALDSDGSFAPPTETAEPMFAADAPIIEAAYDPGVESADTASADDETVVVDETANQESLEQQAHADAATDVQQTADDFVEKGDYAAAAEAREVAETESGAAGDASMLGVYDAQDLQNAADKQEDAAYYEGQEAAHAQAGDYEAAREDASNAGYAMSDADSTAGGSDHTGQADTEYANMDNAVWHQDIADENAQNAADAAEDGNFYAAEMYADNAADEQATADDFGAQGEHGSIMADYDPSAEVETGGSYESSYDDNLAAVDTGYDAGADLSADTSYDSGVDAGYNSSTSEV